MRFYLVDRIFEVEPRRQIRAAKLASRLDPVIEQPPQWGPCLAPTLIIEALLQVSAWLILATTDFAQRGIIAGLRRIEIGRPARVGERIDLFSQVDSWSDEAVMFDLEARCEGECAVKIEGVLCFLIDAGLLEDPAQTRRQYETLCQPDVGLSSGASAAISCSEQALGLTPITPWIPYDRLEELTPGESAAARKSIVMTDPVFATHFPRLATMPGVLLLQSIIDLGRALLGAGEPQGRFWYPTTIQGAKFQKYVRPGEQLVIRTRLQKRTEQEATLTGAGETSEGEAVSTRRIVLTAQESAA